MLVVCYPVIDCYYTIWNFVIVTITNQQNINSFLFCWWFSFIFVLLFITIKSSNVWCFMVNCDESVSVAISHCNPFSIVAKVKLRSSCGFKICAIGKQLKKLYFSVFSSIYTIIRHTYKFIIYHTINCGYYSWTCDKIYIQKYTIFLCKCW